MCVVGKGIVDTVCDCGYLVPDLIVYTLYPIPSMYLTLNRDNTQREQRLETKERWLRDALEQQAPETHRITVNPRPSAVLHNRDNVVDRHHRDPRPSDKRFVRYFESPGN
jgi:hypothetical protein